jgi:hypothetical protein
LPSFTNGNHIHSPFAVESLLPLRFSQASPDDQHIEGHHRDHAECNYVFHFLFTSFVLQKKLVGRSAESRLPLFKAIWARMAPPIAPATALLAPAINILFARYRNVTRVVGR